jgi:hypothetical protein
MRERVSSAFAVLTARRSIAIDVQLSDSTDEGYRASTDYQTLPCAGAFSRAQRSFAAAGHCG